MNQSNSRIQLVTTSAAASLETVAVFTNSVPQDMHKNAKINAYDAYVINLNLVSAVK